MPFYVTTSPPDEATDELVRQVLEDAAEHLEGRLAAIERDFRKRLEATRDYMDRRTRDRITELIERDDELRLRRKKRQPIIPDWRIPGGEFSPDDPRRVQNKET